MDDNNQLVSNFIASSDSLINDYDNSNKEEENAQINVESSDADDNEEETDQKENNQTTAVSSIISSNDIWYSLDNDYDYLGHGRCGEVLGMTISDVKYAVKLCQLDPDKVKKIAMR
jgi:hypothetical protein